MAGTAENSRSFVILEVGTLGGSNGFHHAAQRAQRGNGFDQE
jgi:hypothetical protein